MDIYNREPIKLSEETKTEIVDSDDAKSKEYELLKANIGTLIASDVMLLTMPYNVELSQRLFAFSISGDELCKFDYDAIVFATGIDRKKFSKECWNQMVAELKLPQSEPFDASKWKSLQKNQESVIANAKKVGKQIQDFKKNMNKKDKPKQQVKQQKPKQKAAPKQKNAKSDKSELRRLNQIVDLEKAADKFLPRNLLKVKERQMNLLTTLHDMAAIVGMDAQIIAKIEKSARKQSEQQLKNYLRTQKSGKLGMKSDNYQRRNGKVKVSAKDIEQRQLKLLSTIYATREKLEKLAQSKGVSLDELNVITDDMKMDENEVDMDMLNRGFDALFSELAEMALTVQQTAKQYGVKLDRKECAEVDKHIVPMYNALEKRQNALIAKGNYLKERVKMFS